MKELDRRNIGALKEGTYWVYDAITKQIILAIFDGGIFYYHDHHHPYEIQVSQVSHYKFIPKPKTPIK